MLSIAQCYPGLWWSLCISWMSSSAAKHPTERSSSRRISAFATSMSSCLRSTVCERKQGPGQTCHSIQTILRSSSYLTVEEACHLILSVRNCNFSQIKQNKNLLICAQLYSLRTGLQCLFAYWLQWTKSSKWEKGSKCERGTWHVSTEPERKRRWCIILVSD